MSQSTSIKFATFGPNRGLSFYIGSYEFIDGICEVAERDVSAAASILCRYHDVCLAAELEQKIAEYDAMHQNREAKKSANPQLETPKTPALTVEKQQNLESGQTPPAAQSEKPESKPDAPKESPAPDGGNPGDTDAEAKKNGNGKKPPVKN